MYLEKINSVADLRVLTVGELEILAEEIRTLIIDVVSRNGGHLGANLGTVELCIALHMVFDVPEDSVVFDVGHQAYTHKILTGRREFFESLRKFGGCSGFPTPSESPFDASVSGHAGVAVSTALGISAALGSRGSARKAVAVLGDGSLNCGISLEGLNSASRGGKNLIVILNDNKMSISRNVGGLAASLNQMISGSFYNRFKTGAKRLLFRLPRHQRLHRMIRRVEDVIKGLILPGAVFEEFGVRYLGPINGHSLPDLLRHLRNLKEQPGPVLLHVITEKGRGYEHARRDPARYHGVPGFCKETGEIAKSGKGGFSGAFGRALTELARGDDRVRAITAAMCDGTGLARFQAVFPERLYDVGITEEHAVTFAAGLATGGMRPVCAIYATFMQRALDCIYHDVVLPKLPVVLVLDRAGAVEDGPTHHGIYDLGFLRAMPGLTIMAPRCEAELEMMLRFAFMLESPVAIRYPRGGSDGAETVIPPVVLGKAEIVREGRGPVIWAMGPEVGTALRANELAGADCCVVNARFLSPFDGELLRRFAAEGRKIVTVEDHSLSGGLASAVDEVLSEGGHGEVLHFGWPKDKALPHGKVEKLREAFGLTAETIADALK